MWGGGSKSDVVGQKWQVPKESREEVGGGRYIHVREAIGQVRCGLQVKRHNNRSGVEGKTGGTGGRDTSYQVIPEIASQVSVRSEVTHGPSLAQNLTSPDPPDLFNSPPPSLPSQLQVRQTYTIT